MSFHSKEWFKCFLVLNFEQIAEWGVVSPTWSAKLKAFQREMFLRYQSGQRNCLAISPCSGMEILLLINIFNIHRYPNRRISDISPFERLVIYCENCVSLIWAFICTRNVGHGPLHVYGACGFLCLPPTHTRVYIIAIVELVLRSQFNDLAKLPH